MVLKTITQVLHACNAHVITYNYMQVYTLITWELHDNYMHVMLV